MSQSQSQASPADKKLFWACFIALVATSFFFGLRTIAVGQVAELFDLSEARMGSLLGVGLWPFAFSIIIFSLIIDKIGYKTSAIFAIVVHTLAVVGTVASIIMENYNLLYISTFLLAVANGTVEAFINPVVATVFNKEKSKWLNILHAGWPAGLALGAAAAILMGYVNMPLVVMFGSCLIPVIFYAMLTIPCVFPVQERVAAGVSYRDMLREVGGVGFFLIGWLVIMGVGQVLSTMSNGSIFPEGMPVWASLAGAAVIGVLAGIYTSSLGNWMFLLILITMPALATTELGTDSWMDQLLAADLGKMAGWVFVMISIIMTILRFYAGPIVHKFSAIGLLVASAALAIVGLLFLGFAPPSILVVAAIVYAFGKTFLWSTTLGVVSEQFPKGGALTLNGVSAVGVLGMGILGAPLMGLFLAKGIDADLKAEQPAIYEQVVGEPESSIFGKNPSRNVEEVNKLGEEQRQLITDIENKNKKKAFVRQAVLPGFMLAVYLILFFYFRSKGGYKPVEIGGGGSAAH